MSGANQFLHPTRRGGARRTASSSTVSSRHHFEDHRGTGDNPCAHGRRLPVDDITSRARSHHRWTLEGDRQPHDLQHVARPRHLSAHDGRNMRPTVPSVSSTAPECPERQRSCLGTRGPPMSPEPTGSYGLGGSVLRLGNRRIAGPSSTMTRPRSTSARLTIASPPSASPVRRTLPSIQSVVIKTPFVPSERRTWGAAASIARRARSRSTPRVRPSTTRTGSETRAASIAATVGTSRAVPGSTTISISTVGVVVTAVPCTDESRARAAWSRSTARFQSIDSASVHSTPPRLPGTRCLCQRSAVALARCSRRQPQEPIIRR